MSDVEKLFYTPEGKTDPIEGYLGDSNRCEILFVLREPNDPHPTGFWFRDNVVNPTDGKPREGMKYFYSLGRFACRLLNGANADFEDVTIVETLKRCAYININYVNGTPKKSIHFSRTLNYLHYLNRKQDKKKWLVYTEYEPRAKDCLDIIYNISCNYIVTTWDIFNALVGEKQSIDTPHLEGVKIGKKVFRIASFNGKTVLSFDPYGGMDYSRADFKNVDTYLQTNRK